MDFQGILDNIKEKASSIFEKVREFYEENKMLSYIIIKSFKDLLHFFKFYFVLCLLIRNFTPEMYVE